MLCCCCAGMMEGPQGFDLSSGLWQARGWRQIDGLRRKLERLKELRELVRTLGRAGGRGPRRRAPQEVGLDPCPALRASLRRSVPHCCKHHPG